MSKLALQAKDLLVSARIDGAMVPAIRALSFDLAPGKILGLVGESGAGKSMVGRAIAQLLPAGFEITSGSLLFEGQDLARMAPGARRALLAIAAQRRLQHRRPRAGVVERSDPCVLADDLG